MFGASITTEYITVKLLFKIMELDGVNFFTKTAHQMAVLMLCCCVDSLVLFQIMAPKLKVFCKKFLHFFLQKMLSPHTLQLRLMDLTNVANRRVHIQKLHKEPLQLRDMCCQR